jgi:predicted DsbA family dithiol-disulfide isomerase
MSAMKPLKIDFVSDVACPWCAVGLASLERALDKLDGEVPVEIHFHPFELNPGMAAGGQDASEYLTQKYGSTREQQKASRDAIRARGAAVGFEFREEGRGRIYNTFKAHRLLHWAGLQDAGRQHALKKALLQAYHGQGRSPEDVEALLDAVRQAGLDSARAREILQGDEYAREVRESEQRFQELGIHAVPSVIINDTHLIQGGQPPEMFEQALRQIAAEPASA